MVPRPVKLGNTGQLLGHGVIRLGDIVGFIDLYIKGARAKRIPRHIVYNPVALGIKAVVEYLGIYGIVFGIKRGVELAGILIYLLDRTVLAVEKIVACIVEQADVIGNFSDKFTVAFNAVKILVRQKQHPSVIGRKTPDL